MRGRTRPLGRMWLLCGESSLPCQDQTLTLSATPPPALLAQTQAIAHVGSSLKMMIKECALMIKRCALIEHREFK